MKKHLLYALNIIAIISLHCTAQAQNITTIAGGGTVRRDTVIATSGFVQPTCLAFDAAGNLYIGDYFNHIIRKVDASTHLMTTVTGTDTAGFGGDGGPATAAFINSPSSIAVDGTGNIYFVDKENYRIRKIDNTGIITTIAGTGLTAYNGDGIAATSANMQPRSIVLNAAGEILFTDYGNNRIRKITGGIVSTIAGTGTAGFSGDGSSALLAMIDAPTTIALDHLGNIFFYDKDNHRIRKINGSGTINTVAGNGSSTYSGDGGPATNAGVLVESFIGNSLRIDDTGNIYFFHTDRIRKINTSGIISVYLGGGPASVIDAEGGPATNAAFEGAYALAADAANNLYTAEISANIVRKISTAGIITTYAGSGLPFYTGDDARLSNTRMQPSDITKDTAGNIYLSDVNMPVIRKITPAGNITRIAGKPGSLPMSGDGYPAREAQIPTRTAIAVDRSGNVYIAEREQHVVRKIDAAGIISRFAGTGTAGYNGDNIPATSAQLYYPSSITTDTAGNVYILVGGRIRKVGTDGIITTYAGDGTSGTGGDGGPATAAQFSGPANIRMDNQNNLYLMDYLKIRKIDPSGIITAFAGDGTYGFSPLSVPATSAEIGNSLYLFLDDSGYVYFTELDSSQIKKVNSAGFIEVFAGKPTACGYSGDGGPALEAEMCQPYIGQFDNHHNLYIADNTRLRFVCSEDSVFSSVSISATADTICPGQTVLFTATAVNSGSTATYQWVKNGVNIPGAIAASYSTTTLADLDIITCNISSTNPAPCASSGAVTSNPVTIHVRPAAPPPSALAVVASPASVSFPGETITYTASYSGGGTSPTFQWYKNGVGISGATSNPYITNTVTNGDNVAVTVHTSNLCANPDSASAVTITGVGVNNIIGNDQSIKIFPNPNGGTFSIEGQLMGVSDFVLEVTNLIGTCVFNRMYTLKNGNFSVKIELPENLPNGIYFVHIDAGKQIWKGKFLMER